MYQGRVASELRDQAEELARAAFHPPNREELRQIPGFSVSVADFGAEPVALRRGGLRGP